MSENTLVLSKGAEKILKRKIPGGVEIDLNPSKEKLLHICELWHSGDKKNRNEAAEQIVGCTAPLIAYIIDREYSQYVPKYLDDMFQEGIVTVIKELDWYDPEKSSVGAFFSIRIRSALAKYMSGIHRCSPRIYSSARTIVRRAVKEMQESGEQITIDSLSEKTGLAKKTTEKCLIVLAAASDI